MFAITPGVASAAIEFRLPHAAAADERVWIFDLDNTLYPPSCRLFDQVDARIQAFVAAFLKLDPAAAYAVQKRYYREHGTTLRGLMIEHGMAAADYLADVHAIDVSVIPPNPALDAALGRLHGRKLIYTNGSERHAANVTGRLGVAQHFSGVFDIAAADYIPKPEIAPYRALLERHGVVAERAVMIEDLARNLAPAAMLGMTTVWLRGNPELADIAVDPAAIHHITDDLAQWLDSAADRQHGAPARPMAPA